MYSAFIFAFANSANRERSLKSYEQRSPSNFKRAFAQSYLVFNNEIIICFSWTFV